MALREEHELLDEIGRHQKKRNELLHTMEALTDIYENNSKSYPVRQTINIVGSLISDHDTWIMALKWAIKFDDAQAERSQTHTIMDLIDGLEKRLGTPIPTEEILAEAEEYGISEWSTKKILERLKASGSIFEPKKGFTERIK
jgi:DNA replicative helicase MCM subunit Mcm2 (Cdc46/Mcm family)